MSNTFTKELAVFYIKEEQQKLFWHRQIFHFKHIWWEINVILMDFQALSH